MYLGDLEQEWTAGPGDRLLAGLRPSAGPLTACLELLCLGSRGEAVGEGGERAVEVRQGADRGSLCIFCFHFISCLSLVWLGPPPPLHGSLSPLEQPGEGVAPALRSLVFSDSRVGTGVPQG